MKHGKSFLAENICRGLCPRCYFNRRIRDLYQPYKTWTPLTDEELETASQMRAKGHCWKDITALLGHKDSRNLAARCRHHGITRTNRTGVNEAKLKRLHSAGWLDSEIADELGVSKKTVWRFRIKLGLPAQTRESPRWRKKLKQACRQWERRECVRFSDAPKVYRKTTCIKRGWIAANHPKQCDILDAINEHGPMTFSQIGEAFGGLTESIVRHTRRLVRAGVLGRKTVPTPTKWTYAYHLLVTKWQ